MSKAKVLCVDDDVSVARLIFDVVEFCGHHPVIITKAIDAAARYIGDDSVRAVLTDYMMPGLDGIELLMIWQERRPLVRRVLITAAPNEEVVREAQRSGVAQMVVAKPPTIADMKLALAWL